jgi:hypothetical protein
MPTDCMIIGYNDGDVKISPRRSRPMGAPTAGTLWRCLPVISRPSVRFPKSTDKFRESVHF